MTKTKKKLIKDKLFKILHIVCYVLSAIFILTLFIGSLQSCKNKNNNNSQNLENSALKLPIQNNSQALFSPIQSDDFSIPFDELISLYDFVGVNYYDYTYGELDGFVVSYPVELYTNQLRYVNENTKTTLEFHFVALEDSGNYVIRLSEIYLNDYLMIEKQDNLPWLNDYTLVSSLYDEYQFIYLKGNNSLISPFYSQKDFKPFVFAEQINYYGLSNASLYNFYVATVPNAYTVLADTLVRVKIETDLFYSNGQYFNEIWVDYLSTNGLYYNFANTNNTYSFKLGDIGNWSYFCMWYNNTYITKNVVVNQRDTRNFSNSINGSEVISTYQLSSSSWTDANYRYCNFVDIGDTELLTLEKFNSGNNVIITGGSITGSGNDVFSVFTTAFTSVNALWSIMILPNISLGVLMFLPLVVMLIVVVINILKK